MLVNNHLTKSDLGIVLFASELNRRACWSNIWIRTLMAGAWKHAPFWMHFLLLVEENECDGRVLTCLAFVMMGNLSWVLRIRWYELRRKVKLFHGWGHGFVFERSVLKDKWVELCLVHMIHSSFKRVHQHLTSRL